MKYLAFAILLAVAIPAQAEEFSINKDTHPCYNTPKITHVQTRRVCIHAERRHQEILEQNAELHEERMKVLQQISRRLDELTSEVRRQK